MTNPEVERAAEVTQGVCNKILALPKGAVFSQEVAAALSAAGLLRTEADRLNAELAEAMIVLRKEQNCFLRFTCESVQWGDMRQKLDAILDERKPSPRFEVRCTAVGNHWEVWERKQTPEGTRYEVRVAVFECDSDGSEAHAYVARKNAEEAK